MANDSTTYRVTNSAGGTEGTYESRAAAIVALLGLQFPGAVYAPDGSEVDTTGWELDADGRLVPERGYAQTKDGRLVEVD